MFARIKKSGNNQYLQIVENRCDASKTRRRVIATLVRLDQFYAKGEIKSLVNSIARFYDKVLLMLSGKTQVNTLAKKSMETYNYLFLKGYFYNC